MMQAQNPSWAEEWAEVRCLLLAREAPRDSRRGAQSPMVDASSPCPPWTQQMPSVVQGELQGQRWSYA